MSKYITALIGWAAGNGVSMIAIDFGPVNYGIMLGGVIGIISVLVGEALA